MAAQCIDGQALAGQIRNEAASGAAELRRAGRPIKLVAIRIGEDAAAASYAASQSKQAGSAGIDYQLIELTGNVSTEEVSSRIARLNSDNSVTGIMLHMPVPPSLDGFALQQAICPSKDVERVNAVNIGLLAMGRSDIAPCTAAAAFACLKSTGVEISGQRAVIVGRSNIVGKPLAMLLLTAHATVTQCHTRTRNLSEQTRSADILVVAAGRAGMIGREHVSPEAIVIDVGIHRVKVVEADGQHKTLTVGDVRFDEVAPIASHITPVPGGVGPVTVAMLLANTVAAARGI